MKHLINFFLSFLFIQNCESKEYFGFDLCEKITNKKIELILKSYDGKIFESDVPKVQKIGLKNYPIAKGFYNIEIYTYKEVLHRITIDVFNDPSTPKLANLINDKYKTKYEVSSSAGYAKLFDTSNSDKNIDLRRTVGFGFSDEIEYPCSKIETKMRKELEIERKIEADKQAGSSKI